MNAVTLDIPLFIRLLEVAREEIKSDEDLHHMVERVLAEGTGLLTMDNYDAIMGSKEPEVDASFESVLEAEGPTLRRGGSPSCFTVDEVKERAHKELNAATRLRVHAAGSSPFGKKSSRMESFIQIVSDSVAKLRSQDVYRLLSIVPREAVPPLTEYIVQKRPDLKDEVQDCLDELGIKG